MGKGKALLLGSTLLFAGSALANDCDLFETKDLGSTKEIQTKILDINEVSDSDIILSPAELCCAYGNPGDFKKQQRKWTRQDRRNNRKSGKLSKKASK
ncbi:MAG: hypothetical protein ACJAXI_003020 [Crocinitomicaceae bacterium]|jgi:hypothetical protein